MSLLSRRQFAYGAGAGMLLLPFASMLRRRPLRAAGTKRATRLMLFCTMGTKPDLWSPTGVSDENTFTFAPSTAPLADHKDSIVLVEGLPSRNPSDGHGSPNGITGMGSDAGGYYYGGEGLQVAGSVRRRRAARGRHQPSDPVAAARVGHLGQQRHDAVLARQQPAADRVADVGVQHGVRRRDADGDVAARCCSSGARASSTWRRARSPTSRGASAPSRRRAWTCTWIRSARWRTS